jgi:hypothetical protein
MGTEGGGGARRDRTADLLHAMQALSQLSYGPVSGSRPARTFRGRYVKGRVLYVARPKDSSRYRQPPRGISPIATHSNVENNGCSTATHAMVRHHSLRRSLFMLATLIGTIGMAGCTREKPQDAVAPRPTAVEQAPVPKAAPTEYDVTGKKRHRPRTTMGALEAESGPPAKTVPPSRRPSKTRQAVD